MDKYLGNNYIVNGDNVYRSNGVFISHVVKSYQCSKCYHLSRNIIDSDIHYKTNHMKNVFIYNKNNKTVSVLRGVQQNNNNIKVIKVIDNKITKTIDKKPEKVIIKPLVMTVIDDKKDKTVHNINIESGFKQFEEINCVKNLKTYSRKKFTTNETELSEEKVCNIETKDESVESLGRVLRPGLYECDICGEIYSQYHLNIHKNIHISPHLCDYPFCEEKFASDSQLRNHQKLHEEKVAKERGIKLEKAFKCDLCDQRYTAEHRMKLHRNIHTNPKICDFPNCGKKFSAESKLKFHKLVHNKSYKYKCLICNKVFPYFYKLRQHKKFHTDPVVCEFEGCGKKFINYSQMKLHSRKHSDYRPFKCDATGCQFKAKTKSTIIVHKKYVHSNYRPYKCEWKGCGKRFKTTSTLGTHINCGHKNIRKFVCEWPDCDNKYLNKSALQNHVRSHTGERPYVCVHPNCGKRFGNKLVLTRHEVIHTGLRPYKCDYCGATFGAKSTMDTHKKLIHKCDYIKRSSIDNRIKRKS